MIEQVYDAKLNKFTSICETITRTLKNNTRKKTHINFHKTLAVPTNMYRSEQRSWKQNSSTRNELSYTSKMLHKTRSI